MNKKLVRVILAGLLVIVLAAVAAGCGIAKRGDANGGGTTNGGTTNGGTTNGGTANGGTNEPETKSGSLEGVYTGEADMTEMISAQAGMDIKTHLALEFRFEIKSDKTYLITANMERFLKDTIDYYNGEMPSLIRQAMIDEGIPENMLDAAVQESGYANFEEFTKELLDDMISELESELDTTENTISRGSYTVSGDTLELTEEEGDSTMDEELTINKDGTITGIMTLDGAEMEVIFKK